MFLGAKNLINKLGLSFDKKLLDRWIQRDNHKFKNVESTYFEATYVEV